MERKMRMDDRDRSTYNKGQGYDVVVRGTYVKTRRVRAMNPEQALEFAVAREWTHAPKYFRSHNHRHSEIEHVEAVRVLAPEEMESVAEEVND